MERTHPDAVNQAALYSMALFGEVRDIVVVTMARDSGDYKAERIPAAARNSVSRIPMVWPSTPPNKAPMGTSPISSEFMAPFMFPCNEIGVTACLRLTGATPVIVAPTLKRKLAAVSTTIMAAAGPPIKGVVISRRLNCNPPTKHGI